MRQVLKYIIPLICIIALWGNADAPSQQQPTHTSETFTLSETSVEYSTTHYFTITTTAHLLNAPRRTTISRNKLYTTAISVCRVLNLERRFSNNPCARYYAHLFTEPDDRFIRYRKLII